MLKIEAIIRPFKLHDVESIMIGMGVNLATVSEVRVHWWHRAQGKVYHGSPYKGEYEFMLKLEFVLIDEEKPDLVNAILAAAKTGKFGDGKIFISPVVDVVRIRTGEHGNEAVRSAWLDPQPPRGLASNDGQS